VVQMVGPPAGAVRNRPINDKLRNVLERAAQAAGIEKLDIVSGGQPGTSGGRLGSHRHDGGNAADLKLIKGGAVLNFENAAQRPTIAAFVTVAAANGATGIGGGVGYMGPQTLHVGFGTTAVWGAQGLGVNAPQWLRDAATAGWRNPGANPAAPVPNPPPPLPAVGVAVGADQYVVTARNGGELREGPGEQFALITTLKAGTQVIVAAFEGHNKEWALVDADNDQVPDGSMLSTSLAPKKIEEDKDEETAGSGGGGPSGSQQSGEGQTGTGDLRAKPGPNQVVIDKLITGAKAHQLDPITILTIVNIECEFNPVDKNNVTSAGGLFQFLDGTWTSEGGTPVPGHGGPGDGMAASAPIDEQIDIGCKFTAKNIRSLTNSLGSAPSLTATYMAHQQGLGGALKILKADPNTAIETVIGPSAARNNGFAGLTVAQTIDKFRALVSRREGEVLQQVVR
jgi:hypothetical protein